VKETFLDAVRAGNYATWPGLTTTLIAKHFPNLEETQNGHMKGQRKGIQSTKVREQVEIKIEPGTEVLPQQPMKKQHNIFCRDLQTHQGDPHQPNGCVPCHITTQIPIHNGRDPLGCKLNFCKLMKNRTRTR
jgi:hypothetical protein